MQRTRAWDAAHGFSLRRAAGSCFALSKLFVPIDCHLTEIDGKAVYLVDFYGGRATSPGESKSELIDKFANRVAQPWCFETRSAPKAPRLVFQTDTPGTFSEYSCTEMLLGKRFEGKLSVEPASMR
jgi:hypothetical protein